MTVFIIQSFLLLAVAFILGCLLGGLLRYLISPSAEAKPAPKPEPKAAPAPVSAKEASKPRPTPTMENKNNLQEIKGIGPVLEKSLHKIGVFRFDQIAAWTKEEVADFNEKLSFSGRIERDEWLKQAAELAKKSDT